MTAKRRPSFIFIGYVRPSLTQGGARGTGLLLTNSYGKSVSWQTYL
jgi:hypothetical protein